jgi:hypothetical protein
MNKKLQKKCLFILAFIGLLSVDVNAQHTFSAGLGDWGLYNNNDGNQTISHNATGGFTKDGSLDVDRNDGITGANNGNNAGIRYNGAAFDGASFKYIKLRYRNETTATAFRVLGYGSGNVEFNSGNTNSSFVNNQTSTEVYKTVYLDMSGVVAWTGNTALTGFSLLGRAGTPNTEGTKVISFDQIDFLTALPTNDTTDPVFSSGTTATAIDENSGAGQVIYTALATDDVAVLYYALSGTDAAAFTINPGTGAVTLTADPNFESKASYSFIVTAYDEKSGNADVVNFASRTVTLAINDVAEGGDTTPPVMTSGATATVINENSGAGQVVYTAVATDQVGVTGYTLTGTDAGHFTINSVNGQVTLAANPDFEVKASYSFTVRASDAAGNLSVPLVVSLAINNVYEDVLYTFDSNLQGWTVGGGTGSFSAALSYSSGSAIVSPIESPTVSGTTNTKFAIMYAPTNNNVGINTAPYTHIKVTLKNETSGTKLRVRVDPLSDNTWSQLDFDITANDTEFKSYTFVLSNTVWTGSAADVAIAVHSGTEANLDPWTSNSKISYDSIEFTKAEAATQDGTWEDSSTWGGNAPSVNDAKTIDFDTTINSNIISNGPISITSGKTLTINSGFSLTLNSDLVTNGGLTLEPGAQLIVNGEATGWVKYKRTLTAVDDSAASNLEGWFTVSPPVSLSAGLDNVWADNATLVTSSDTFKRGIASYTENDNSYSYLLADDSNASTFTAGQGYIVKRNGDGTILFNGALNIDNAGVDVAVTKAAGADKGFNLLGNPYTSSVDIATFIADNTSSLALQQVWIWTDNGNTFNAKTSSYKLAPGQAFFVKVNANATLNFSEANQSIDNGDLFGQKSAETKLKLTINNGKTHRYAEVYYLDNASQGYDAGNEGEVFNGMPDSFSLYTHLLSNNEGKNYQIQSLPNSDLEAMVVPVGVKVAENSEITFKLEASNIPSGLKVFLEDRQLGVFTQLDVENAEYKVAVTTAANGVGRFYLHTAAKSALSTDDVVALQGVSIFKSNNTTLKIAGLQQGKAAVSLFNIQGKQILTAAFEVNGVKEISLPKLATGVYVVQLTTEAGKLSRKIILE